jgi:hypothetical protein
MLQAAPAHDQQDETTERKKRKNRLAGTQIPSTDQMIKTEQRRKNGCQQAFFQATVLDLYCHHRLEYD